MTLAGFFLAVFGLGLGTVRVASFPGSLLRLRLAAASVQDFGHDEELGGDEGQRRHEHDGDEQRQPGLDAATTGSRSRRACRGFGFCFFFFVGHGWWRLGVIA